MMLRKKYMIWLNWIASMLAFFSMGCLYGAHRPDIPVIFWVGVIFFGACIKIWLHHQSGKIDKS